MDTFEFLRGAITVASGVGGAIAIISASAGAGAGFARAAWRAGGQWGIKHEHHQAALDAHVALERARAEAENARAVGYAAVQPRSVHYAPHVTSTAQGAQGQMSHGGQQQGDLPGIVDLTDVAMVPGRVLLGLANGGTPITTTPAHLMHVGCIGATGSGKTNAARFILAQILALGRGDVYIANPHFVANDLDDPASGDWRIIESRLAAPAAYDERYIGLLIDQIAASVDERWAKKREGQRTGKPQILYIDELPAILDSVPGALQSLATILRRGRAVGVYLLTLSQDLATKTLGRDAPGAIRENYRTGIYTGGDPHSAQLLLDTPRSQIGKYEGDLGRGVALVKAHGQPATLARIPFASNAGVAALLSQPETPETPHAPSETPETVSDTVDYEGIITRLRAKGHGKKAIIEMVWGARPGGSAAYREASAAYDAVVG